MSWNQLLATHDERVLPWLGGRTIFDRARRLTIRGALPPELGWHRFSLGGGRNARWVEADALDLDYERGREVVRGYLVGDRMIADQAAVRVDPRAVFEQTEQVWLAEPGLDRFARALAVRRADARLIYVRQEFPQGPEQEVLEAWQDRKDSIDDIAGVTPALQLAFVWLTQRRAAEEARAAEAALMAELEAEERARAAEQRRLLELYNEAERHAHGRRVLARRDFGTAAKAALAVSGAELLDHRDNVRRGEKVVQFRFKQRRFECVVHAETLRVIDAGVCLINHATGERGDDRFTLESLPAVIDEAMRRGVLHVFRRV
ncbi:MAG: hypothetical protein H6713_30390 [Myxococcales bacterium]|nr:hypothetical protein [Myxococcales bacterium]MCB9754275.1 hypothetical protein [Myxococcales bacterium]